tara:strand:- start:1976 stop:2374 length:399 start_codon:yes stop_codon:yes gene_type:complete
MGGSTSTMHGRAGTQQVKFTGPDDGPLSPNVATVTKPPLKPYDRLVWGGVHGRVRDLVVYQPSTKRFDVPGMRVRKVSSTGARTAELTSIDLSAINDDSAPMFVVGMFDDSALHYTPVAPVKKRTKTRSTKA